VPCFSLSVPSYSRRPFELPLSGGPNPGDFPISGTTTTPDSNPPNNADSVVVSLVATCINPLGTGSLLTCPPGQAFVGPNEKPINSTDTFVQQCCVSVRWQGLSVSVADVLTGCRTPFRLPCKASHGCNAQGAGAAVLLAVTLLPQGPCFKGFLSAWALSEPWWLPLPAVFPFAVFCFCCLSFYRM
jgi:hypothetical protein